MYKGTLKKPESNKKKIIVIISVIAVIALSASGGLFFMLHKSGNSERTDEFGPRRMREWTDSNAPNPDKQKPQEIMSYMDSSAFNKLSDREKFMYSMRGGRKVMEYQMDNYFTLKNESQKTAYLDQMIDRMEAQRANFEQMRSQMPRRDPNDPNRPQNQGRRFNVANMRARGESGTPLQQAKRQAFFDAMRARMQQRGITMPAPGGPPGRGGFGGRGGR